jgi:hypothetical protein
MKILNPSTGETSKGAPLYQRRAGQAAAQPAYIEIDVGNQTLRAGVEPLDHDDADEAGWAALSSGEVVRVAVPYTATSWGLLALMEGAGFKRLARRVIAGYRRSDDGKTVQLSTDAAKALDEMHKSSESHFDNPRNIARVMPAVGFFLTRKELPHRIGNETELAAWAATYTALAWLDHYTIFETDTDVIDYLRAVTGVAVSSKPC